MANQFAVERTETIDASPQEIFPQIGNLQGWDNWSPWGEMDPNMNKTYSGEPGTVGSSYHWTGNRKVGEGRMTLTDVRPDEKVEIDLNFIKPFKSRNVTEIFLTPEGDGTMVTWRMTGPHTFMTKVMGFIGRSMDKMVGPDFEKGLAKLKQITEA